jgi:hypothetical protein
MIRWDLFGRGVLVRNWGQSAPAGTNSWRSSPARSRPARHLRGRHRRSGKGSRGGSHRARQGLRTGDALATFSRNPEVLGTHPLRRILPCCRSRRQLEEEGSWWPSAAKPARTVSPCNRTGRFSSLSLPGGESKTIDLTSRTDVSRHTREGQNREACRTRRSRVHK